MISRDYDTLSHLNIIYNQEYSPKNYHPTHDERIAYFQPLVTSRGNRKIKLEIFNRKQELQITLVLRETDDFKIHG